MNRSTVHAKEVRIGSPVAHLDKKPGVLVLEASVGSGHTRAAQALCAALQEEDPERPVVVQDVLETAGWSYRICYRFLYMTLARHFPYFLDLVYERTEAMPSWLRRCLLSVDRREFHRLLEAIRNSPPALIVCTHFLPLEILSELRKNQSLIAPLWGVVTDVHPHGIWVYPGVDRYIVPLSRTASEILKRTDPATEVHTLGLPVHPDFSKPANPGALREKWKLPDRLTVLLMSGGFGIGSLAPVLDSFLDFGRALTLVAVAGKNRILMEECESWGLDHEGAGLHVRVVGFVRNIHEWMALSDLVVTKPGGLSVFEALSLGKPLVLLPPRGGQERKNSDEVTGAGAGLAARRPGLAGSLVRDLAGDVAALEKMSANARKLGNPYAARALARMIVGELSESSGEPSKNGRRQ